MRVLVASLGFSYRRATASANRCRPDRIVLITVGREDERVENAVREVELYGRMVNASVESRRLDPEDFWSCVGDAAELFAGDHEYYLDVGGGVRAPAASCWPRRCWPWPIWARTWSPCTPWRSTPRG